MAFEVVPPSSAPVAEAIRHALAEAGVRLESIPESYASPWRRAAVAEAVDGEEHSLVEPPPPYTPSPRSTRGATRA